MCTGLHVALCVVKCEPEKKMLFSNIRYMGVRHDDLAETLMLVKY